MSLSNITKWRGGVHSSYIVMPKLAKNLQLYFRGLSIVSTVDHLSRSADHPVICRAFLEWDSSTSPRQILPLVYEPLLQGPQNCWLGQQLYAERRGWGGVELGFGTLPNHPSIPCCLVVGILPELTEEWLCLFVAPLQNIP